jgi:hypothetical protein
MRERRYSFVFLVMALATACGQSVPVAPVAIPTATPAPIVTPTPTPTPVTVATPSPEPEPEPCDGCEPAVTNRNSPVRLTLRLYTVEDGFGRLIQSPDPAHSIPLGWFARLDVVAKDINGDETNGNEEIIWHFSETGLVNASGNHTHQRRLKAIKAGYLDVWVTQEGVRSNTIGLILGN